jgi:hypothetical protein
MSAAVTAAAPPAVLLELPCGLSRETFAGMLAFGASLQSPAARLRWLITRFLTLRIPFQVEGELLPGPAGVMRIQLRSMDCATFVYYLLAMMASRDLESFRETVRSVRYAGGVVAPSHLLHYTWNVMRRFVDLRLLENMTESLAEPLSLETRCIRLGVLSSGAPFLREPGGDPNIGEQVCVRYLPTVLVGAATGRIEDGDTLLLVTAKPEGEFPLITGHLAFAFRPNGPGRQGPLCLAHCSKSRLHQADGESAGVSISTYWDAERRALLPARGFRTLPDYLEKNPHLFRGVVVFRARGGEAGPT